MKYKVVDGPWIEFNGPAEYTDSPITKTYKDSGLSNPGVLVEFDDGEHQLIGDINGDYGRCGCCAYVSGRTVVRRYKVLLERVPD